MNADTVDFDVGRKFVGAHRQIIDHGAFPDQQKALVILGGV